MRAWVFNALAFIAVITAFSLTLSIVHDVSNFHCHLTTNDILQIALVSHHQLKFLRCFLS